MPVLLLASENRGKWIEIQALLKDLPIELKTPADLGMSLKVVEDGATYVENAAIKARAFSEASGLVCLADDSGLEVDALDGKPGLFSARFAAREGATDADRRRYLLERLQGRPRPWTAHFHCTVAISTPDGDLRFSEGNCPGEIIPEERGTGGFGYDPIFLIPELGKTMAELPMEEKNRRSHRALAVIAARPVLREMFGISLG
ncbi:MAG TPA: RdgB/HAM1 family non-canonical purine NTP pyrophosphatase [Anaerolineaceae bacterium]|nr:RdgB/HAM1 family non-canonical purine NTP pyrophosphatase [Anaerolineaceae bacterium]